MRIKFLLICKENALILLCWLRKEIKKINWCFKKLILNTKDINTKLFLMNGFSYGNIIQSLQIAHTINRIFQRAESIFLKNILIPWNIIIFSDKNHNFQNTWHILNFLTPK